MRSAMEIILEERSWPISRYAPNTPMELLKIAADAAEIRTSYFKCKGQTLYRIGSLFR